MDSQPIYGWDARTAGSAGFAGSATQRSNRRRLRVFLATLIVALAVTLAYTFLRSPIYRASARIEITPAGAAPSTAPSLVIAGPEPVKPFLTEVQTLTSRPLLEETANRLRQAGYRVGDLGVDPVAAMQSLVDATTVDKTNVVELVARGARADLLAPLVNTIVEVYRARLLDAYKSSSGDALAQADAEVAKLEAGVASKRRDVEAYRMRNNIVSIERDEGEALAKVRDQSATLAKAQERQATAEGNLRALTDAQAAGSPIVRSRDNPTVANLEQRASQAREELRDLERSYTREYLAKDPRAVALHARIDELDRQLIEQRRTSQQAALADAREELAGAEAAVRRLQSQIGVDRQDAARLTASFNEYKARQDALTELEKVHRDAVQRRVRLEASEQARAPNVRVLESAATPAEPWRPLYWRDAGISAAGSFLLALLAMWLVELFNRSEPAPSVVVAQALAPGVTLQHLPPEVVTGARAVTALPDVAPPLLPQPAALPRNLGTEETAALLAAAENPALLAILLLLSGVDTEEAIALRGSDVDLGHATIRIEGEHAREIPIGDALRTHLAARSQSNERLLQPGPPMTEDAIDAWILSAAHDARLRSPAEIDAKCLRHTFIAFLVGQGIRFSDLQRLVGSLPAQAVAAYASLSPPESVTPFEAIDPVLPAIRQLARA